MAGLQCIAKSIFSTGFSFVFTLKIYPSLIKMANDRQNTYLKTNKSSKTIRIMFQREKWIRGIKQQPRSAQKLLPIYFCRDHSLTAHKLFFSQNKVLRRINETSLILSAVTLLENQ